MTELSKAAYNNGSDSNSDSDSDSNSDSDSDSDSLVTVSDFDSETEHYDDTTGAPDDSESESTERGRERGVTWFERASIVFIALSVVISAVVPLALQSHYYTEAGAEAVSIAAKEQRASAIPPALTYGEEETMAADKKEQAPASSLLAGQSTVTLHVRATLFGRGALADSVSYEVMWVDFFLKPIGLVEGTSPPSLGPDKQTVVERVFTGMRGHYSQQNKGHRSTFNATFDLDQLGVDTGHTQRFNVMAIAGSDDADDVCQNENTLVTATAGSDGSQVTLVDLVLLCHLQ